MLKIAQVNHRAPKFKQIKTVYEQVFPKVERLPLSFLKMRAKTGNGEFLSFYNEDTWVGFAYSVVGQKIVYLFFLAIAPAYQSSGYGSQALTLLQDYYKRPLLLSAEREVEGAPNLEQRQRRQAFYAKNGFQQTGFYTLEKNAEEYDLLADHVPVRPELFTSLLHQFLKQRERYFVPFKLKKK